LQAIMERLKRDKRAVSNAIVVMLSLVLVVIIVANIVLWSYQMNQLDLERMQENVSIANVTRITRSSWFTAQNEYTISAGSRLGGTCTDTRSPDGSYETFREERTQIFNPSSYVLNGFTGQVSGSVSDLTSNNDVYMNSRSYQNYEIRYQESLGISLTTSTTYQDKVSISLTPQITADFVIIAAAEVKGSSTSYQARAQLIVNATTCQELRYRVKDTTDWYPFSGLKRMTLVANTNYAVNIQFCSSNAGATASIRNARIIILSLQSEYAESENLSSTSSTSWQDKTNLAFTPPIGGDYLIIATVNYRGSSTTRDTKIQLIQDGTIVHADTLGRPQSGATDEFYSFGVMRKVTLDTSLHNFKIQYCTSGTSATADTKYAHIVAIGTSQFDNVYYNESESESSPAASGVWYDKVTNTYTAVSGDHLIIGSILYKSGSTSNSVGLNFTTDSTSRQQALVEHRASTDYESAFFMTRQTLTAGSKTDKISWMSESTNARVKNARLISCRLPTLTQTVEVEFAGVSNTQNWTQLDWTVDSSFTTVGVLATFQLYNYQTTTYPTTGDGYMSDTIGQTDATKNQTIISSPTDFRDSSGNWKIRIKGVKPTDIQFELKIDWVEFKATMSNIYRLSINNSFEIDLTTYLPSHIQGIEIIVRYNVSEAGEKWFLKAYNWTSSSFSDLGFNNTGGNQPILNGWNDYSINLTDNWMSYAKDNGTIRIEFQDEGLSTNQTIAEIDFFSVRTIIDGVHFDLTNSGPLTTHIVAVWMLNSTSHQRYDVDLFMNSGEETVYIRADIRLPSDAFIAKVVTERGNLAVFAGS
jgi:hypothetical protein